MNGRSQDAHTHVKGNKNHLAELVFSEYDQRCGKETEAFVCWIKDQGVGVNLDVLNSQDDYVQPIL